MPYDPPANDAVDFKESGSYSPPANDAVDFQEGGGDQLSLSVSATASGNASVRLRQNPLLLGVEATGAGSASVALGRSRSLSVTGSGAGAASVSVRRSLNIGFAATASGEAQLGLQIGDPFWSIAGYAWSDVDTVEVDAKTVTLSGVAARYRLEQLRTVRAAAEKVDVVVDDEGRFRAVDRSRDGNTYLIEPPTDERPPRETADMLVADYSEERVSKQENKSEVTLTLQRPASRDATGDEPSQTRGTGEWLLEFHSGAIATRRITPERTSAVETAKDIESLQLVLTAEQTLVLETSATHPDAVSVVEVPDGTNLAQDNSSADRQTVEVTAATGKEGVLEGGTYVVAGWGSTRIDADSYEVSLDLRPEA